MVKHIITSLDEFLHRKDIGAGNPPANEIQSPAVRSILKYPRMTELPILHAMGVNEFPGCLHFLSLGEKIKKPGQAQWVPSGWLIS